MVADIQPDVRGQGVTPAHGGPATVLWHWQPATDALLLSNNAVVVLGIREPPGTGAAWLAHLPPHDQAELTRALRQARDHGQSFTVQLQWPRADGGALTLQCRGLASGAGTAPAVSGTLDPVADNVPETLAGADQWLATILDTCSDAVVGLSPGGTIRSWNTAAQQLFGYRPEDVLGRELNLLIPATQRQACDDAMRRAGGGERVELPDTVHCCASNGARLAVRLILAPVHDARDKVTDVCAIIRAGAEQTSMEPAPGSDRDLLTTVMQTAPIALILLDGQGSVQLWNQAAEHVFGWSAAEIAAPSAGERGHRKQRLLSELHRHAAGGSLHGMEAEFVRKDGTLAELSLWFTRLGPTGPRMHTAILAADISDRRRAHRALREQEQRLFAALSASRTGTFRWNIRSNVLQWDQNLDRLFGTMRAAPVRNLDQFIERLHPQDRAQAMQRLQRCARDGTDLEMDLRVTWSDGQVRWLYVIGQTFCGADGLPDYMTGAGVDITHRKQAEEALRESEARFRTLADNIAQFAWMADGRGWIFWYNQRWFDYTGTTLEQMQGWGWRQVHHPDHVDRVVEKISECFASGAEWEDTFPLRSADGSYRWFLSRAIPIHDQDGKVTRWFGTNTDITERREMEEALREADRRKDAFLATLAHELRNPLAPIINGMELLRLFSDDRIKGQHIRDTMDRQARHLVRLVDDLLDVSRISRNKVQLKREPITLQEAVESAVETVAPLVREMEHSLRLELPPQPLWLHADPTRLAQIFANLLNNAAKYTAAGGDITVRAEVWDSELRIFFIDNGVGIEPDMLERIFDMFTQNYEPESGRGGLGIGLTLVKALVELHGGSVWAHSPGRGMGSRFVVTLPLPDPDTGFTETNRSGEHSMAPLSRQRILVVDDNEDAAVSTAMLLEAMGSEVRTAYDGEEALGVAADFRPQVVLLDLGMPKLNGYEAARRLRQQTWAQNMVLIALTGWGQDQDRERTRDAGFDHHLVKPVDPSALRNLLVQISADTSSPT